ncbi:Translation initiation factor IF-2 [Methanimicrococcus sp. At1]|uniref:Probable translation initiation factor IF-2 n=1 Tax=Methanimicrococcus hacksteinii TaxID=3028293 RepID=A0ABU3VRS0_9EURY|nr:translation initiation factor IF-2 [Methanimicrococcus sp. At1]MDV0445989.1 Translation initiation factor IF-2 [Methanimicrococcus sp. At1]
MAEENQNLRTPIVCVMGHVDHGKTTLLDQIRGTAIVKGEAGAITQHIGATEVPIDVIVEKCGDKRLADKFIVPGLLFIDTPGHHAFTTLRSRGGSLADLAVVVVDINEGFKPQTIESLNILKRFKTPFIVVTNKIDRILGWQVHKGESFLSTYKKQTPEVQALFEQKFYDVIGHLYEQGFSADRFDRVTDFQKTLGVIPISGLTGEGIPDVLMILLGLAQRFLESSLQYDINGPGVGTVLEVKEEKGLGTTIDVILYDGTLKKGDTVVIGRLGEPIVTKVRALLKPRELSEIRYESKFQPIPEAAAAAGVKISAPDIDDALAGAPIISATPETLDAVIEKVKSEIDDVQIQTDTDGVMIKADTIGSLEAMVHEFKKAGIQIQKAEVGDITKRDVMEASTITDPKHSVILAFNVKVNPDAQEMLDETLDLRMFRNVRVFKNDVIYRILDDYQDFVKEQEEELEKLRSDTLIKPGQFKILPGCVFRQSKPAVVGVRILGGVVKNNTDVMLPDGTVVGTVKGLELNGKKVPKATAGMEVAMAIDGVTVGRQVKEEDILYVHIPESDSKVLEFEIFDTLTPDEQETLEKYLVIRRKDKPFWGK